jgi:hypothetical protein
LKRRNLLRLEPVVMTKTDLSPGREIVRSDYLMRRPAKGSPSEAAPDALPIGPGAARDWHRYDALPREVENAYLHG